MATRMMSSSQPLPSPVSSATHQPRCEDSTVKAQPRREALVIVQLVAVNIASLAIGFNDASSALLIESTIPETSLTPILLNALPFTIGTILAAAFLDPIARNVPGILRYPYFVLSLFTALLTSLHGLLLVLPMAWSSELVPLSVTANLLLGVGHSLGLTMATLLCNQSPTQPGAVYGMVALGVTFRTATAASSTGSDTDGLIQQHSIVLGLATLSANLLLVVVDCKHHLTAGDPDEESALRVKVPDNGAESAPVLPHEKTPPLPLPSSTTTPSSSYYPPPTSRTTVLAALFTFTQNAFVATIPAWLSSLCATHPSTHDEPDSFPAYYVPASLWAGLATSRFLTLWWHNKQGKDRGKQPVSWALMLTAGVLLLPKLVRVSPMAGSVPLLACVVGCLLGPVYPAVVCVLLKWLSEGEEMGGIGIVVAFGSSGAVAGLVISQSVAQFSDTTAVRGVLFLVVGAVLLGGMMWCWRALPDELEAVDEVEVA